MKYYYLIVFLFLISCKSVQSNRTETHSESKTLKSEPQIVFYFFKALKNANNNTTVKLIDQKIIKGVLKDNYSNEFSQEKFIKNNWIVTFTDLAKQNIIQLQINNPLIEDTEFINDEGSLEKKRITHKSKEFVIRVPFNNSIKAIRFENIIIKNQKSTKILFNYIKL